MESSDLTILFLTVNIVPKGWAEYHKSILLEAANGAPIITISKEPLDWGIVNLIQEKEPSVQQIYEQILRGAKIAKTPYIAIAEDDTLYHKCHFAFRPPLDTYAFEGHRWGLFTWGKPTFYWSDRISNGAMIAPRRMAIDSLTERFEKYPVNNLGELGKEKGTRIDRKKSMTFYSDYAMIFLSHSGSLDPLENNRRKAMGKVQAYRIPYWGEASDVVVKYC
ncbi:MAG: hypothetical protein PH343_08805 [Nitrospira sp.]|nr:hypothetical protein [Nitrospira sp.]